MISSVPRCALLYITHHRLLFKRFLRGQTNRIKLESVQKKYVAPEPLQYAVQPMQEEELQKLVSHSFTKELSKSHKEDKPVVAKVKVPEVIEPIMEGNQYEKLAEAVTPLYKVPYERQLKIKQKRIEETMQTLATQLRAAKAVFASSNSRFPCPLETIRPSPDILAYRNKDEFSIQKGIDENPKTVGFFVGKPSDPLMRCVSPNYLVNLKESHKIIAKNFQEFIRQSNRTACLKFRDGGIWRNLTVRSNCQGDIMAIITIYPPEPSVDSIEDIKEEILYWFTKGPGSICNLSSLYLQACSHTKCNREEAPFNLLHGNPFLVEECLGQKIHISPDSFFQSSTKGAEVLYQTLNDISEVSPVSTLLDICCGTGIVSIIMSSHVRGSIGIDNISSAIEDAQRNAVENEINNATFIRGKAEEVLPALTHELKNCLDVVAIVNPTRAGIYPNVVNTLRECEVIRKLIYISCKQTGNAMNNFVDLCRKRSKKMKGNPFSPKYAIPIDLFPHTHHTELLILFER